MYCQIKHQYYYYLKNSNKFKSVTLILDTCTCLKNILYSAHSKVISWQPTGFVDNIGQIQMYLCINIRLQNNDTLPERMKKYCIDGHAEFIY